LCVAEADEDGGLTHIAGLSIDGQSLQIAGDGFVMIAAAEVDTAQDIKGVSCKEEDARLTAEIQRTATMPQRGVVLSEPSMD